MFRVFWIVWWLCGGFLLIVKSFVICGSLTIRCSGSRCGVFFVILLGILPDLPAGGCEY